WRARSGVSAPRELGFKHEPRHRRDSLAFRQCVLPLRQRVQQLWQMDSAKIFRIARQIPSSSTQQRTRTDDVSLAVMVEPYCNLNQTLQKRLLRNRASTPSVFEHFMGLEVGAAVEQSDSPKIELRVHTLFCLKDYRLSYEEIRDFISYRDSSSDFLYE